MQRDAIKLAVSDAVRVRDVVVETERWTLPRVEVVVSPYFTAQTVVMPICLTWKPALARAPDGYVASSSFSLAGIY